jgi:hypothetical protein
MILTRVISATLDKIFRRVVKVKGYGNDTKTGLEAAPYGTDSNPIAGMVAVYSPTAIKGKQVIIGYINKNQLAAAGEHRTYSTDSDGELKFYIWQKADGTCEIGGNTDFMVRFSKLKEAFDELQDDVTTLKQAFSSWVVVPSDGGAALKAASATWAGTAFTKSIDPAKIAEVKTL